jgi:hypothetical protein
MSSSVENDSGAEEETINGDVPVPAAEETPAIHKSNGNGSHPAGGRIVELLQEERDGASTPEQLGNGTNRYKFVQQLDNESEDGSSEALPRRAGSPLESILSNPDDSPSVQVIISQPLYLTRLSYIAGLFYVFPGRKQLASLRGVEARSRKPESLLSTL